MQKCSKGDVQRSLYSPTAQYSIDEASLSKLSRKHLSFSLTPFAPSLSLFLFLSPTTCFSLFFSISISMTHNFIPPSSQMSFVLLLLFHFIHSLKKKYSLFDFIILHLFFFYCILIYLSFYLLVRASER